MEKNKLLFSVLIILIVIITIVGIYVAFNFNNPQEDSLENNTTAVAQEINNQTQQSSENPIDENRPVNDPNYKGYNPLHESEITPDGWNPREHEVSRTQYEDGTYRIDYDDGYFRICDENGYVITYGY